MKKEHPPTSAQQLFEKLEILTKRPEDMPYEDYKVLRKVQQKLIKIVLK
jgi:hypothetical protein